MRSAGDGSLNGSKRLPQCGALIGKRAERPFLGKLQAAIAAHLLAQMARHLGIS
jgi:hypothetical protein